jgi:chromate transporter
VATPAVLREVVAQWGRIGYTGFGGPPAHIALLRELCVDRRGWLTAHEFEDAVATCNLLPGPASTQLAIYCAWRVAGPIGALVGGAAFILPGLVAILALAVVFLSSPPDWVRGVGAGAGAAVAAVAVHAGLGLVPDSWRRAPARWRWVAYAGLGGAAAATLGPWLVLVLIGCGAIEVTWQIAARGERAGAHAWPIAAAAATGTGGVLALVWVAFKVGALPVTQTVAVVGYAAYGIAGGLLAALVAFAPSFAFVLLGARRFDTIRHNRTMRAFLAGAGPAAIGAIVGVAIPLALALDEWWQFGVLVAAAVLLFVFRRGVVATLLLAGAVGLVAEMVGAPLP